jgi:formate-dependent nitrite reductase membrane component NrfD
MNGAGHGTANGGTGNGTGSGVAARLRERWGMHGRGQHERDKTGDGQRDNGRHGGVQRGGRRGRGGEQLVVPRATPDSYYGRPVLKQPVWEELEIAGYFFLGGLAGASSVLAAFAQLTGNRELARASKVAAAGAIGLSTVALIKDLGRPARFANMLRVFKPSSPMSVGTWLISGFAPCAAAAAASAVTGRLPRAGALATMGAAVFGPGVASYTAALVSDTAIPAWHEAHREMPYLFVGSAAAAAGGFGMLAVPTEHAGPAIRFAVLGGLTELTAKSLLLRRLGETGEPYQTGHAGQLMDAAELLIAAGLAGAVLAGRSRVATAVSGVALMAASAATRFGVFEAGQASALDPKYTVRPQRERVAAREAAAQEAADREDSLPGGRA